MTQTMPIEARAGLREKQAAEYVGLSVPEFAAHVLLQRLPQARELNGLRIWGRKELDAAMIRMQWVNPGFVYFVQAGTSVKVGFTTNVSKRLKSLQTASPYPLHLLHVEPGHCRLEKLLHRRFAKQRLSGEWFRRSGPVSAYLNVSAG